MNRWFRSKRPVAAVSVGLVALLAGLLFTVNARVSGDSLTDAHGVRGMVIARQAEVTGLEQRHAALEREVDGQLAAVGTGAALAGDLNEQISAGTVAVSGPGLRVTMADSTRQAEPGDRIENYLVHQQDLDAVIAALWAGGAEAVTVQNHRLTATTAILCVGNVILVAGRLYAPPYVIEAIGPVELMETALTESPRVTAYVEAASALGLGWSVGRETSLDLPAASGVALSLRFAQGVEHDGRTG